MFRMRYMWRLCVLRTATGQEYIQHSMLIFNLNIHKTKRRENSYSGSEQNCCSRHSLLYNLSYTPGYHIKFIHEYACITQKYNRHTEELLGEIKMAHSFPDQHLSYLVYFHLPPFPYFITSIDIHLSIISVNSISRLNSYHCRSHLSKYFLSLNEVDKSRNNCNIKFWMLRWCVDWSLSNKFASEQLIKSQDALNSSVIRRLINGS